MLHLGNAAAEPVLGKPGGVMRLVVLYQYYLPESFGGASRWNDLGNCFARIL
jgi:hypothetical protein